MKIGLLGSRGGWHEAELGRALLARGAEPVVAPITGLNARLAVKSGVTARHRALDECGAVIVRAIPRGSLEQIIFRMDVLHGLARVGIPVVNSARCIERTVDKYYTSALLTEAGLPTPHTVVCERFDDAMAAFEEIGGEVVVKPLFGSEGRGMVRIADGDLAYRTFRALEEMRAIFYLQEFVAHAGGDIRAFVVGGRVIAAMRRRSDGWKTNLAQGAQAEATKLPADLTAMSERAAAVVEADYAGVDLLSGDDGRQLVLEVNGIPGWQGLQATTEVDIAAVIADHALEAAARRAERDGRGG